MLLVIDAGNSSISLGLFETPDVGAPDGNTPGGRPALLWNVKIAADPQRSADEYRLTLGLLLRDGGYSPADVDAVALGSVVPALTHTLREARGRLCRRSDGTPVPLRTVGAGTRTGLVLQVDDPAQLGADIVTGAAAAVCRRPPSGAKAPLPCGRNERSASAFPSALTWEKGRPH